MGRLPRLVPAGIVAAGLVLAHGAACVVASLDGHACPCLDGYGCVEGKCLSTEALQALCPESFVDADKCGDLPPGKARLVAVCDPGTSFPGALKDEVGDGLGICSGDPAVARMVDQDVSGTMTLTDRDDGAGYATIALKLKGSTVWDVDVPESCKVIDTCLPSQGSGTCITVNDGCACSDVELDQDIDAPLSFYAGRYSTADTGWFGCTQGPVYALREDNGVGLGPVLLFAAE